MTGDLAKEGLDHLNTHWDVLMNASIRSGKPFTMPELYEDFVRRYDPRVRECQVYGPGKHGGAVRLVPGGRQPVAREIVVTENDLDPDYAVSYFVMLVYCFKCGLNGFVKH